MRGFSGYTNFDDFYNTLGLNLNFLEVKLTFVSLSIVTAFITKYMWSDPTAIYILIILFGLDLFTGVLKSLINKTFSSYKLGRFLPQFMFAIILLTISFHLGSTYWFYEYLPALIYGFISSQLFISLIENASELGWIDVELLKVIKSRFNFKKLLTKIDEKDKNDNNDTV